ncbi:LysR family transcriptional regulator [Deinococcus cellulosilyticus]|uniref:Putative transcription regulator, LysR family protein n=1 Tax=Deinococcus cellulosilyticus (strain DSM 18568 / NBRC 106333 / KACC 11606 / 5516J-15) TaxID=1223518 RepID=A0A511N0Q0_DEIC1|nr:LysR family transcriptional regulator [Deinococcus cellulosilyticus]GEM46061.1 putative transcription regulator, LysR family protein [Deinococcus cellulosilyticus NBRC 106333 = KACC 11606]
MKLSQLRALLAVADTGSFSEAAMQLGLSQSSVSESITALEKHLNVSLLLRGRAGARLTSAGEQVVVHARTALRAISSIEEEVVLLQGKIEGTLNISTFRSIASHVVPRIMQRVRQDHPGLHIQLIESQICDVPHLLQPLDDGRADLAFVPQARTENHLSWKLLDDPYDALVPAGSIQREVVTLQDLTRQPLMVWKEGDCAERIAGYLKKHQLNPPEIIRVQDDFTMYNLVAQNLGMCLAPRLTLDYVPHGAEILPLQEPLNREICLAVRPGGLRIPAVRYFIQQLKKLLPASGLPDLDVQQTPVNPS